MWMLSFITIMHFNLSTVYSQLSTLGRVKNYLRNSYGDEWLGDLLVLSCLSDDAKDLDLCDVVENFARLKSRRYSLMH